MTDISSDQYIDNISTAFSYFENRLLAKLMKRSKNILDIIESGISGDLASALDNDKIEEGQNSERLRDFYKQLIQTDAQIRRLKEAININNYPNDKSFADRFKRSLRNRLKFHKTTNSNNNKNSNKHNITNISNKAQNNTKTNKSKRSPNDNNVTGIIVKNEKIMVQYEPDKEKFWKNFNTHEVKAYENKLHQSLFKMKQNILEMMSKQQQSVATTNNNIMTTRKFIMTTNKNMLSTSKINREGDRKVKEAKDDFIITGYKMDEYNKEKTTIEKITNIFNILDYDMNNLLSMTTYDKIPNISFTTPEYKESNIQNFKPGKRKLMQVDEEEVANYDDLKEVLRDDQQYRGDLDREFERVKRDGKEELNELKSINWGPLKSEEVNAMIKQAAMQNLNIQIPVNTKDIKIEKDQEEKDISDTEYVEDYIDNKHNKMVKMAQAYSDYGVVYGKSDSNNNNLNNKFKTKQQEDFKFRLPFDKQNLVNRFFRKLDKGFSNDGIKIEFKSGNIPTEHNHHAKGIEKHIKILNNPLENPDTFQMNHDYEKEISIINFDTSTDSITSEKPILNDLRVRSGSRSLMFVDYDENSKDASKSIESSKATSRYILGDIMLVISNWFKSMGRFCEKKFEDFEYFFLSSKRIKLNTTSISNTLNDTNSSYYIDNGNHKSRMLMSTEDNSNLKENIELNRINNDSVEERNKITDLEDTVPIALVIAKNMENATKNNLIQKPNSTNKIIVKRSPENIFWNDLYDNDEYGVHVDYLDGPRNKHSVHKNVVQKSKDWIKKKVHKIKDRFRKKKTEPKLEKSTTACATKKRPVRQSYDNENNDIKKTFEKLTANMKKVCQKAARDIENTKHVGVREENKEDKAATSLMQHLVRLMADLVDIQVQQKTCAKLPADLRDFLEWLTVPADSNVAVDNLEMNSGLFEYATAKDRGRYGKSTDPTLDLPTYNEDTHQDDRTECLGIIKSVQDLIQRYEEMTDEDKSKMTGVREYLENQLEFLNTKLGIINDYNSYKSYDKRQISRNSRFVWNSKNHRHNRINKFIKPFGKKHTKSTPHSYDGVTITKIKKKNDNKIHNNLDNVNLVVKYNKLN